jgi:hypothetical protein
VALRAVDAFFARFQRYPGTSASVQWEQDADILWDEMQFLLRSFTGPAAAEHPPEHAMMEDECESQISENVWQCVTRAHAMEVARYGATELHAVSAVMGGVGAQEAVKLLTRQYVCIDNTFVYNGVAGVGALYRL